MSRKTGRRWARVVVIVVGCNRQIRRRWNSPWSPSPKTSCCACCLLPPPWRRPDRSVLLLQSCSWWKRWFGRGGRGPQKSAGLNLDGGTCRRAARILSTSTTVFQGWRQMASRHEKSGCRWGPGWDWRPGSTRIHGEENRYGEMRTQRHPLLSSGAAWQTKRRIGTGLKLEATRSWRSWCSSCRGR